MWARIFAAFLILSLASSLLLIEAGLVRRELVVPGPFTGAESPTKMFSIPIPQAAPFLVARDDSVGDGNRSRLRLWANGTELTKAHALHDDIRSGASDAFSHWGGSVYFLLPPGTDNAPGTSVKLNYPIQLASPWLTLILLALLGAIWFAVARPLFTRDRIARFATVGWMTLLVASWVFAAASAIYSATIIYGLLSGYALPTTAIFFLSSSASSLHRAWLFLPWSLLGIATTGAAISWVAARLPSDHWQTGEQRLTNFWNHAAIPIIFLTFLFDMSGGGWSGHHLRTDLNYMSNAGLTPSSDAVAYYSSAFEIGYWGHWNWIASQRPFAAALRSLTVFLGGETYQGTLVVQTALVTLGIAFALRSVVAWRGFWVGLAFFALVYGLIRPFLPTMLTENLGFLWAMISIGFFAESLRRQSLPMGLLGFATLTGALMTRMGSMFSIPALMAWLPFAFARQWRPRLTVLVGAVGIAVGVVAANGLLGWLYGAPGSESGGNFSSVLCGLAHGSNWGACYNLLSTQIGSAQSISATNHMFYAEAMRAFRQDPFIALHGLWRNGSSFAYDLPAMLVEQYLRIDHLDRSYLNIGVLLLVPGWTYLLAKPGRSRLVCFALLLGISSIFSAAVIFADDGTRTMIVAYVFAAFLVSLGLSTPGSFVAAKMPPLSWQRSTCVLVATLFVLLVIPPIQGAAVRWASKFPPPISPGRTDTSTIPGRPIMTGFIVVPDGSKRRDDIPSLDLSQYTAMYRAIYATELGPAALSYLPQAPFAVVFAVPQDLQLGFSYFVGPPELMTNRTPSHWRLEFDYARSPPRGQPFLLVSKATPAEY